MSSLWNDAAHAWAAWTAPLAWHLTIWAALAFAVDRIGGRRLWPQLRLGLWLLVGIRLLVPAHVASPVGIIAAEAPTAPIVATPPSWLPLAFGLWCGGALLVAAGFVLRTRAAWNTALLVAAPADARLRRAACAAADRLGLRRAPRVAWVPSSLGAAVLGTWRPLVLIPRGLTDDELEHALLHEFGHVKRRDLWVQAAFRILCIAYWFHPLIWVAARCAHRAREMACDQTVAACLGEADGYRRTLLAAAQRRVARPLFGSVSFAWRRAAILSRVDALERGGWRHRLRQRFGAGASLVVAAAVFLPATQHWIPPDPLLLELQQARAQLAAAQRKDPGYGSMHARYAAMRVASLEQRIAARRQDGR